ncbi:MAG: zf-HC2 domain-containing protein [Proteobacteria bacterium]|nr:zf-HC2 domain-containing protein [Pseudomonadota bacterium]
MLYDSGELEGAEAARFERHLADCEECGERLESSRRAHLWAVGTIENAPSALIRRAVDTGRPAAGVRLSAPILILSAVACMMGLFIYVSRVPRPVSSPPTASERPRRKLVPMKLEGGEFRLGLAQAGATLIRIEKLEAPRLREVRFTPILPQPIPAPGFRR